MMEYKELKDSNTCLKSDGTPNCFLYHVSKKYCALDGKQHVGCFNNFMPIERITK